jgi:hypothetical protein
MHARRLLWALLAPALVAVHLQNADAQTVVEGASKKVTVPCGKGGVRVAGLSNQVTLTGVCENVTVEGKSNTVHIATLGRLTLAGSSNRVYWKDGIDGRMPRIDRSGTDNVAERRGGTTELKPAAAASSGGSSAVSITAEKDKKATVVAGGVVVDSEKGTSTRASEPKPAGRATAPASSEPAPAAPPPPPPPPPPPAAGSTATLVFADNREERTVDCEGRTVEVLGNRNRLRLRGSCAGVRVSGNVNVVEVDLTPIIATTGNENTVRYRDLIDGERPKVANTGRDNTIRRIEP